MAPDTGKPLTEPARVQAGHDLQTVINTARAARALLDSSRDYTAASLLTDIAAMEAILRRVRQAASPGQTTTTPPSR
jgi:hypothetical protein